MDFIIYLFIYLFVCLFVCFLFIYLFIHLFIYSFIYLFVYLIIYLFIFVYKTKISKKSDCCLLINNCQVNCSGDTYDLKDISETGLETKKLESRKRKYNLHETLEQVSSLAPKERDATIAVYQHKHLMYTTKVI